MSAVVGCDVCDLAVGGVGIFEFGPDATCDVERVVSVKDGVGAKVFVCSVVGVHLGGGGQLTEGIVLQDEDRERFGGRCKGGSALCREGLDGRIAKMSCKKKRAFGGVCGIVMIGEGGGTKAFISGVGAKDLDPFEVAGGMEFGKKAAFGGAVGESVSLLVGDGQGWSTRVFAEDVQCASNGGGCDPADFSAAAGGREADVPLASVGFGVVCVGFSVTIVVDVVCTGQVFGLGFVGFLAIAPDTLLTSLLAVSAGAGFFGATRARFAFIAGCGFGGVCFGGFAFDASAVLGRFGGLDLGRSVFGGAAVG